MPAWSGVLDQIVQAQEQGVDDPFRAVRLHYLNKLYSETNRDVILYSTGWTQYEGTGPQFSINSSDIQGFMEVVHGLDFQDLDIILHSPGGSAEAAEQIVDYLRAKFDNIRVFVPQAAMSAATMLCCAADEVVMGEHSSLGPIDPQFMMQTPVAARYTPAHSIIDQFNLAKDDINTNSDLLPWLPILRQYGPGLLAECDEAIDMSKELVEEWAFEFMHEGKPDRERREKAADMAEFLSDRSFFKSHSRRISRDQAKDAGFDVTPLEADDDIQDIVLSVFHATIHTHRGQPVAKLIENQNGRTFFRRIPSAEPSSDGNTVLIDSPEHPANTTVENRPPDPLSEEE